MTAGSNRPAAGSRESRGRIDLLELPVLGTFLRWRHARTALQSLFLALAALILLDGWFGLQLAPRNLAGVVPWVHWRGFVVLALLVAGNLFCMACPFMLTRRLARRLLPGDRAWPAPLRSKWLAVALLGLFFWAYEAFALWDSPWLTAWVAAAYFIGAFVVDGFFRGASFCRFVCPIGQFHFVHSTVSPTEVAVRDPARCGECTTLDCIRGRYTPDTPGRIVRARDSWEGRPVRPDRNGSLALAGSAAGEGSGVGAPTSAGPGRALGTRGLVQRGCELALYQPRKHGNLDCTFCMECIHACPHDNVGIFVRSPLGDLADDPVRSGVGRLSDRPDLAALALLLVFAAFVNALGMVQPIHALRSGFVSLTGVASGEVFLGVLFLAGLVVVPAGLVLASAWSSVRLAPLGDGVVRRASRFAWGLVPVGFGMWTAHYLHHLLVGGRALVPIVRENLAALGLPIEAGRGPMGPLVPEGWLMPIQVIALQGGLFVGLVALHRIARTLSGSTDADDVRGSAFRAFLPWGLLATLLVVVGAWLLMQPMDMRGTPLGAY